MKGIRRERNKRKRSRRKRQKYRHRLHKEKGRPLHLEILHERSRKANKLVQLEEEFEREILRPSCATN